MQEGIMEDKSKVGQLVSEKMVFIHAMVVTAVCVVFGIINCFSGNVPVGIGIVAAGVASCVPTILLK